MSAARSRFITFEGGDGAGKSTQSRRLVAALEAKGLSVCATREPGGAPGAEDIRKLLIEGAPGRWDALSETLLLFAARADHLARTIHPALAEGRFVVCDRFTDLTFAYQGAGRGLDESTIAALDEATTQSFRPELTLILDVPVAEGLSRAAHRSAQKSRYEQFDEAFHTRLRDFFHALAHREPERCVLIDSTIPPDDVATRIWQTVSARFGIPA